MRNHNGFAAGPDHGTPSLYEDGLCRVEELSNYQVTYKFGTCMTLFAQKTYLGLARCNLEV